MPVVKSSTVEYKALPVIINPDGSVTLSLGTIVDGVTVSTRQIDLSAAETAPVFAAQAAAGKSRWNDLSDALYALLISRGDISGTVQ